MLCREAVVRLAPLLTGHENALRVAMGEDFWMVEGTLAIATRAQGRDVYTVLNLRKDRLEAMPVPEQPEVLPHGAPNDHAAKRRKVLNPNTNGRSVSVLVALTKGQPLFNRLVESSPGCAPGQTVSVRP